MPTSRGRFKRQESWRLKRVKENWRRPRGVTSRMRKEKNGWPSLVKVGHGSSSKTRGRHPKGLVEVSVQNEGDLEGLNPTVHIVRLSGHLGEKRRLILVERVKSLNIHIANPGKVETGPAGEEEAVLEPPASEASEKRDESPLNDSESPTEPNSVQGPSTQTEAVEESMNHQEDDD